jgi:predicted small lipoprotein YifL
MLISIQEHPAVKSRRNHRFSRLAILSAMAGTLALTGCGRKGPLDLPPAAAAVEQAPAAEPQSGFGNPLARPATPAAPAAFDSRGRPVAPKGEKRSLPIDWLLD